MPFWLFLDDRNLTNHGFAAILADEPAGLETGYVEIDRNFFAYATDA